MNNRLTVVRVREAAAAVLEHTSLDTVRVTKLSCHSQHPMVDGPFEVQTSLEVKAGLRDGAIDCFSLYTITSQGTAGREAWRIRLELLGSWTTTIKAAEVEIEQLNCFAIVVGSMTLHPYARETVQNAVARLGYPPFTMEMLTSPIAGADEDIVEFETADEEPSDNNG